MTIQWNRGDTIIHIGKMRIPLPGPLLWLNELDDGRILVTTIFTEQTPAEETNVFLYDVSGNLVNENKIEENGRPVKFLGSEIEDGEIRILGANDMKYTLDPVTWKVLRESYYR